MADMITVNGKVTEDGKLVVELPPNTPHGNVEVTLRQLDTEAEHHLSTEDEATLDAEFEALINDPLTFAGAGLTAEEIAQSPEIGIWKNREEMADPAAYIINLRRKSREKRMRRDD